MAELPEGVRLASGYLVERGGVVTGRCHLVGGVSRDRIGVLGLKRLFIEIHIYLTSLHLAGTTTYA